MPEHEKTGGERVRFGYGLTRFKIRRRGDSLPNEPKGEGTGFGMVWCGGVRYGLVGYGRVRWGMVGYGKDKAR